MEERIGNFYDLISKDKVAYIFDYTNGKRSITEDLFPDRMYETYMFYLKSLLHGDYETGDSETNYQSVFGDIQNTIDNYEYLNKLDTDELKRRLKVFVNESRALIPDGSVFFVGSPSHNTDDHGDYRHWSQDYFCIVLKGQIFVIDFGAILDEFDLKAKLNKLNINSFVINLVIEYFNKTNTPWLGDTDYVQRIEGGPAAVRGLSFLI